MSEIADEEGSDLMIDLAAAQIHSLSCAGCLFGALRRIINGLQRRFIHKTSRGRVHWKMEKLPRFQSIYCLIYNNQYERSFESGGKHLRCHKNVYVFLGKAERAVFMSLQASTSTELIERRFMMFKAQDLTINSVQTGL